MFSAYLDFEITIGRSGAAGYVVSVHGPGGDARSNLVLPFDHPTYQAIIARLSHLDVDETALIELGQILFRSIFHGPIKEVYTRSQGTLSDGQGMRLIINIAASEHEVVALPWEFLYDPDQGPLALLDTPITRYLPQQAKIPTLKTDLPLKVLLTAAQTPPLIGVERELHAVQASLAELGAFVEVTVEPHLTAHKLQRLLRGELHVWHFVGHGGFDRDGTTGQLAFEDATGDVEYVSAPQLGVLLNRSSVRLVVLDACEGARVAIDPLRSIAPALVRAQIPAVVAMQFSVPEEAARAFATEFYQALAEGFPVDACVTEGRKAVMHATGLGRPDWGIPVLYTRAADEMLFDLPSLPKPRCPYPGMVPFRAEDARFFYGREAEIQQLLQHLRHQRLLFVIGPSGSGKSSLVRAGVLSRLQGSGLFPERFWLVREFRPGGQPLVALSRATGGDPALLNQAVADLLAAHPPAQRLLLVIDQFEELFSQAGRDEQHRFITVLNALRQREDCALLIAMRADFYPDLMNSNLWPIDASQRVEIAPLRGGALREAIERPAEHLGVRLEPGLVERMLADGADEPGVLPLLQETLVLLWDKMIHRLLPLSTYERLGREERSGLAVAMASKADATLAALGPAQQAIASRIFLRLIQFGEGRADTRRQQAVDDLRSPGDDPVLFEATLHLLTNNRLLTLSGEEQDADRKVDIAHEALITGWPILQGWVVQRREAEQTRRRLEDKAREWVRLGRSSGGLLDEIELLEADRWLKSADAAELGYDVMLPALVEASRAHFKAAHRAARRRTRTIIAGLTVGLILVAGLAVWGGLSAQRALDRLHLATSRQLAAQARSYLSDRLDLAVILAVQAYQTHNTFEARDSLLAALAYDPHLSTFFHGHAGAVNSVAFSPDGKLLASSGCAKRESAVSSTFCPQGELRLWDVTTRQAIGPPLIDPTGDLRSVAFSPDGMLLATGSCTEEYGFNFCGTGQIRLWNVSTGQPLDPPLRGKQGIQKIVFSPDGKLLASGSCGDADVGLNASIWCTQGEIRLWDVTTRRQLDQPLAAHTQAVGALAFSPDGKLLASGSCAKIDHFECHQGEVRLWDIAAHRQFGLPIPTAAGTVSSLAFSPYGTMLAVASCGTGEKYPACTRGEIELWDVATRQALGRPLTSPTGGVLSLNFSPSGNILAAGGKDGTITLWDATTRQPLLPPLKGHRGAVASVVFSPDGRTLASGSADQQVLLWEIANRQQLGQTLISDGPVNRLAVSPNGTILATGSTSGTIRLWDTRTRQPLSLSLQVGTTGVDSLSFSPDGKTLLSDAFGTITRWDVATLRPLDPPITISDIGSHAFSPDGQKIAVGAGSRFGGRIHLWDVATGQRIDIPTSQPGSGAGQQGQEGHKGFIYSVTFSPDGRIVASGSSDQTVILWDATTGVPLGAPIAGHSGEVSSLAFSPDGHTLAAGSGGEVMLWDVATRAAISLPLTGHTNAVNTLAFSRDGQILASGSLDHTIRLWDVPTRQPLGGPLVGHTDEVNSLAFNTDGTILASGSADGTIVTWDLNLDSLQARACRIANRNLTQAEWNQFIGPDIRYQRTCPDLPPGTDAPTDAPAAVR